MAQRVSDQYEAIAQAIEVDGIGDAFLGGHITPTTNDERLNNAITKVLEGLAEFNSIIDPYRL